eukprot:CAMPEP_0206219678 /NCGR_PEP_ID=MMETSP0047_2-20121206/4440_1 /ASSEMBLY_ACC=CAM_ASM_000192 /TAXON_ID=195065 /ORGANISM="Chroomonas mesostigmatica_cf, Strain CCMP1168" /LENGTH=119 /DNA_ID=CAMNT_0053642223 /DNA_START=80 /DNA_END=435 /DNA_ORIENTATION=+
MYTIDTARVAQAVDQHHGKLTPSDAALSSGLPIARVRSILFSLCSRLKGSVKVYTKEGGEPTLVFQLPANCTSALSQLFLAERVLGYAYITWALLCVAFRFGFGLSLIITILTVTVCVA